MYSANSRRACWARTCLSACFRAPNTRGAMSSDHRLNRISRRDVKEQERHQEDAKQRGKKEKQPLKEEATHRVRSACIHR